MCRAGRNETQARERRSLSDMFQEPGVAGSWPCVLAASSAAVDAAKEKLKSRRGEN